MINDNTIIGDKMKKKSIWLDNIKFDNPKKINKNMIVDVLVIGGGITGLSTAYHLINSKLKICVVEKKFNCSCSYI